MCGVLSIYIFKRYQSSEILIKDKDHQCLRQRESTHIPALLCRRPSPTTFNPPPPHKNSAQKSNYSFPREGIRATPLLSNIGISHRELFCDLEKHQSTRESELPCELKLPLSSYITNERMRRRIFFHNSWTINMHMFKILLLQELLLKIDAFYL